MMRFEPTGEEMFAVEGGGFVDALEKSDAAEMRGAWQEAVEMRWEAFQALLDALPDEAVELDRNDEETLAAIEIGYRTALDHFLALNLELAAALFEQVLEFDPEDHCEATIPLAYCYVALEEWEFYNEILEDIDDKSVDRTILMLWSEFRRTGALSEAGQHHFRTRFAPYYAEFTASEHPADRAYLDDIRSSCPSIQARAREKWFATEHLWLQFGKFI